jgi:hypothetical protein
VEEVVAHRRAAGYRTSRSIRSLGPLSQHLRQIGVAPLPVRLSVLGPVETALADYSCYLAHERGLAAATIQRSTDLVRPFLAARSVGDGLDLQSL